DGRAGVEDFRGAMARNYSGSSETYNTTWRQAAFPGQESRGSHRRISLTIELSVSGPTHPTGGLPNSISKRSRQCTESDQSQQANSGEGGCRRDMSRKRKAC